VQAAFFERYAAQCGFCTSGMVLAATALLERKSEDVTREEILHALSGHICRCTGYVKIVDAVEAAARGDVGSVGAVPEPGTEPDVVVPGSPA
jgi:aerobic-type carbon monoxide dehydrogenase small subunit (CoxS/CutS family)